MEIFLVKVFTEGKKVVGKAFLFKKRFVLKEKNINNFYRLLLFLINR